VSQYGKNWYKIGVFTTDLTFVNQTDNSFVIKGKTHQVIDALEKEINYLVTISKRSNLITLTHALMKSLINFCFASFAA